MFEQKCTKIFLKPLDHEQKWENSAKKALKVSSKIFKACEKIIRKRDQEISPHVTALGVF
jgi:hypothetical protein